MNNKKIKISELENEIRLLEKYNFNDQETIGRMKDTHGNSVNIDKLLSKISDREEKINDIYASIDNIDTLMEEIIQPNVKKDNKKDKKNIASLKREYVFQESDYELEKEKRYFWKRYQSLLESVPPFIQKNIENSPNNKAWVWRGIVLYGHLPNDNSGVDIIFDRKDNIQYVHKVYPTYKETFMLVKTNVKNRNGKMKTKEEFVCRVPRRQISGMI